MKKNHRVTYEVLSFAASFSAAWVMSSALGAIVPKPHKTLPKVAWWLGMYGLSGAAGIQAGRYVVRDVSETLTLFSDYKAAFDNK